MFNSQNILTNAEFQWEFYPVTRISFSHFHTQT